MISASADLFTSPCCGYGTGIEMPQCARPELLRNLAEGNSYQAAFLLGVSSAVCTRQPLTRMCWHAFTCLPGPPSMRGCFAYGPGPILRLLAPDPVLHVSAPVRRGDVADARLGLA